MVNAPDEAVMSHAAPSGVSALPLALADEKSTRSALLQALYTAQDADACQKAAEALADFAQDDLRSALALHGILDDLVRASRNTKSGYEREGALVGLEVLFRRVGGKGGADAYFVPLFPVVLDRLQEVGKAAVVSEAAERAVKELCRLPPPQLVPRALDILFDYLEGPAKWRSKVGALEAVTRLCERAKSVVADRLGSIIPRLTQQMRDSKPEVAAQAVKAANAVCAVLENPDVIPFVPLMVSCMERPDRVPEAIKKMSSNVWVRDVDGPTLAVVVPLVVRGLGDRGTLTLRSTTLLASNLFKMVRSADLAAEHVPSLLPGVERIEQTAALPELREYAAEAARILKQASEGGHAAGADIDKQQQADEKVALQMLQSLVSKETGAEVDAFFLTTLAYVSAALAGLVRERNFTEPEWLSTYLDPYLSRFLPTFEAEGVAREVRKRWVDIDRQRNAVNGVEEDDDEGERLTDIPFSLAYGGLLLLNHTTLRLIKGRRYGVCGANGAGKSTLLKAINRHQIENFPEHLKCVYVEHDIDGVEDDIGVRDFLLGDKLVKESGASVATVDQILDETGFDAERRKVGITALSGGWKMRLALARAMICKADILLLDEPTNHLDVRSVKWLEDYLISQNATILTVSHDSGFLDAVCTDIIHYENKRLVYYRGNLKKFVEKHPAAKSYYTLGASSLKFTFPPPGHLMGVRSNTRGILKMTNCTFTYPGGAKPSLHDVSCAVSLSSRVGIVGPNGAGKSTLIKLLTGETIPDSGKVDKHPNLRVAYIAQHAFHHIEEHLEKTATQYIKWRYQDGTDRELAAKSSRKMSEEERKILETPIEAKTGEKRQIEMIIGRQKLKKSFTYEIKWKNMDHKYNVWIPRERLIELGFSKIVQQFDDFEASREGSGSRELSGAAVRKVLEDLGLDGEIAEYNEMSGLSGGQKVKVVIAAALWAKPQVLILDEPTNFLDRDALSGLAVAIRDWAGAFVCISHNQEFVGALCPEIWSVEAGRLTHKGKAAVIDDAFGESKESSRQGSRAASRLGSATNSAANSAAASRANSGDEAAAPINGADGLPMPIVKKKKLTRKQLKDRDERRRLRTVAWLSNSIPGATREPDTDSDA